MTPGRAVEELPVRGKGVYHPEPDCQSAASLAGVLPCTGAEKLKHVNQGVKITHERFYESLTFGRVFL
jgi:hypothetical protein